MAFPESFLQELADRNSIEDVVSGYVHLTKRSGANLFGCTDFLNHRRSIIGSGMQVYTYSGECSQHTKTILINETVSIVGSFNFDIRSAYLDTEMMLVIERPELNKYLRKQAEDAMEHSAHLLPSGEKEYGAYYCDVSMSTGKKIFYSVFRCVIIPIRHLI